MTSKYHIERNQPMYRAAIKIKGPKGPTIQYVGPYSNPATAKGQVTYHRNRVWKQSFIDGWIETANDWTRYD